MLTCVVGGGGFIGKHVVSQFIESGRDVRVIGRGAKRPGGLDTRAEYRQCDYGARTQLREGLQGCEEIVDLAYATVPQTSFADPMFDLMSNLPPAVGLLEEVIALSGLRRLLMVSSGGTVYGRVDELPITEATNTQPISPYGITKLAIERYALMYHHLKGVPAVVVRPANAYGLGQQPFTGQGFIATAMGNILKDQPVTIFGRNGTIRDYIHVKDVASGIVSAMDGGEDGQVYNVGSAVGRSNADIIAAIEPFAIRDGHQVRISVLPERGFDVPANILDSSRLHALTGWTPSVSLTEGIAEMWQDLSAGFPAKA